MSDGPRILADWSVGTAQAQLAELGGFRADTVAVIEAFDPNSPRVTKLREGFLEPRGWHESIGKQPLVASLPGVLDRRFSVAIISDLDHGFGSAYSVTDKCSPFKNDWDHGNKSTRIVDGLDPRGRTGLISQIAVISDVPSAAPSGGGTTTSSGGGAAYAACIPLGPTIAAKDGTTIPAGYITGKPAPASSATTSSAPSSARWTAALSTAFYIDPNATGQGAEGTQSSRLGIRSDAYLGDVTNQRYGPLKIDTGAWPSIGSPGSTAYECIRTFDSATKTWRIYVKPGSSGGGGGLPFGTMSFLDITGVFPYIATAGSFFIYTTAGRGEYLLPLASSVPPATALIVRNIDSSTNIFIYSNNTVNPPGTGSDVFLGLGPGSATATNFSMIAGTGWLFISDGVSVWSAVGL